MGFAKRTEIESKSDDFMNNISATIAPVKEWRFDQTSLESKVWNISRAGKPIELTIEGLYNPWQLSSLNESVRKTLTLRLPKEWDQPFDCMEACLLHEVQERSAEFLGSPQSPEHIAELFKPITKKSGEYPRHLRAKVQTSGAYAVRYWDKDKKPCSAPDDHSGMHFTAKVVLRSLWFSDDAWGLCAECTDLMMQEQVTVACPF